jgi:CHAT domain-containing protein/TolA-binding protein
MTSSVKIEAELLEEFDDLSVGEAAALLGQKGFASIPATRKLIELAMDVAESAPQRAERWLAIGEILIHELPEEQPGIQAQIHYAQARLHLLQGRLQQAEAALIQAQILWRTLDDRPALARSYLGMTQILTLQGRYDEAEQAIRQGIIGLPDGSVQQALAYINLANLLRRRTHSEAALTAYDTAQQLLQTHLTSEGAGSQAGLEMKMAHLLLNRANVLVTLDRPTAAEESYKEALHLFEQAGDILNRGRVHTNLGSLYLRMGQYADAMETFQLAEVDLLGDDPAAGSALEMRQADILLLDQANAYLALNLWPEALDSLHKCQALFEESAQPYELGQSLYLTGMLHLHQDSYPDAERYLGEAYSLFQRLSNPLWADRTSVALAMLHFRRGDLAQASQMIEALLAAYPLSDPQGVARQAGWDVQTVVDVCLLASQIQVHQHRLAEAEHLLQRLNSYLNDHVVLPHLSLRLHHAIGQVALRAGRVSEAIDRFRLAIDLLERQRISLQLEEFRTAYLDDKRSLYSDLVQALLAQDGVDAYAQAFHITERSRSRALLERMQASMQPEMLSLRQEAATDQEQDRQIHWLYNQMLDPQSGRWQTEGSEENLLQRTVQVEHMIRRVMHPPSSDQRCDPSQALGENAQPVELATFQAILAEGQQALVYYTLTGTPGHSHGTNGQSELVVFLIDRERVCLHPLCSSEALEEAWNEFQFQIGRIELGLSYYERHQERLMQGVQSALGQLYNLLIRPIRSKLSGERLLFIPYGLLHRVPLHALWDGRSYLFSHYVCSYVPSASIGVQAVRANLSTRYTSLSGFALDDPSIPQARREVETVARHFDQSQIFVDLQADLAGLSQAAEADVLHIATHGLFRPDNPFFSSLKLADGWIDVRSIYRLNLKSRLVVLSACESGTAKVMGGDEIIGLTRGFLGAGAEQMVVSLWNVHDQSVVHFMDHFYEGLMEQGYSVARALQMAQLKAANSGQHPYFWVPFISVGL